MKITKMLPVEDQLTARILMSVGLFIVVLGVLLGDLSIDLIGLIFLGSPILAIAIRRIFINHFSQ